MMKLKEYKYTHPVTCFEFRVFASDKASAKKKAEDIDPMRLDIAIEEFEEVYEQEGGE